MASFTLLLFNSSSQLTELIKFFKLFLLFSLKILTLGLSVNLDILLECNIIKLAKLKKDCETNQSS